VNTADAFRDLYTLPRTHFHAIVAVAVLNALDLLTTKIALDRGAVEGNPLAELLLRYPAVLVGAKVFLCGCLLAAAVLHRRVTASQVAAAWFVVGVYSLVVVLNTCHILA